MGRRIAACAAVMALMITLSACKSGCGVATAKSGAPGTACVPAACVRADDCTACYHGEADRNVSRLRDDLPPGGCCVCPPMHYEHTTYKDPCGPCSSCGN